jgi:O-methyltransferase
MLLIQSLILKLGYQIVRFSQPYQRKKLSYSRVLPYAIYSPWLDDSDFQEIYKHVKKQHTLVDEYRCFELWQLVEQANNQDPNAHILEVGVWRGGTSVIMAKHLALLSSNSKIYSADTFTGVVKTSDRDASYSGGEHSDTSLDLFAALIKRLNLSNVVPLQGIFPDETSIEIPSCTVFKLCHIDVDVYQSAKDVQDWIWDKLIVGGIIIFDDYGFASTDGITNFVNEQRKLSDRVVVHNLNGHAVIIKVK